MRKGTYRYVRYYLEIPKRIAEPSLGIELEARRLGEHIIIGPEGHSDFFSLIEKASRQDDQKCTGRSHACVGSHSNSEESRRKPWAIFASEIVSCQICIFHAFRDEAVSRDFAGSLVTEEDHLERISGACRNLG